MMLPLEQRPERMRYGLCHYLTMIARTKRKKKSWGDIYRAAVKRGYDHGYAGYLADRYEEKADTTMTL